MVAIAARRILPLRRRVMCLLRARMDELMTAAGNGRRRNVYPAVALGCSPSLEAPWADSRRKADVDIIMVVAAAYPQYSVQLGRWETGTHSGAQNATRPGISLIVIAPITTYDAK